MSDTDDFEEDSPDDFSASEDEWKPSKKDAPSSEDEDPEESDEDEEGGPSTRSGNRKRPASSKGKASSAGIKRKAAPNLRAKLFKRYKPPPKTVKSPPGPPRIIPGTIQQILEKSRYQKGKRAVDSDDSGSSGDEHLVSASDLDLQSSFFTSKTTKESSPPPNFDCNVGMRLSDSEDEEENPPEDAGDTKIMSNIVSRINQSSSKLIGFRKLADFTEEKPQNDDGVKDENLDISKLLAIGESTGSRAKSQKSSKSRKRAAARDSESDWEEVEDAENPHDGQIPAEGIVVELPSEFKRKTRKEIDIELCIRRKINRQIKENQVYLHKVSLLCLVATGNSLNGILCKGKLMDAAVKLLPSPNSYPRKNGADSQYFNHMINWFRSAVKLEKVKMYDRITTTKLQDQLDEEIRTRKASCFRNYVLIFLLLLRGMTIDSRLVLNYTGPPLRPLPSQLCRISAKSAKEKEMKAEKSNKNAKRAKIETNNIPLQDLKVSKIEETSPFHPLNANSVEKSSKGGKVNTKKLKGSMNSKKEDPKSPIETERALRTRSGKVVMKKKSMDDVNTKTPLKRTITEETNSPPVRKTRSQTKETASGPAAKAPSRTVEPQPSTSKQIIVHQKKQDSRLFTPEAVIPRVITKPVDRRVYSSDSDGWTKEKKPKEHKIDAWVEVWSDKEHKWLPIDLFNGKVDKIEKLVQRATQPVAYTFSWHPDKTLKDVSPRYCPQWNTTTRKFRIDQEWLTKSLKPFVGRKTKRDKEEDRELDRIHLDKPLPKTISEFKDHPLYVLERHLLKYQALYPPNPPTLGFIRKEPVYARECVHTLHTRETWLKQARVVKPEQTAYKIVKTLKWDKYTSTLIRDHPLEVFGIWQTSAYVPPVAKDGIVPRNEYGNVELFKECMLPGNTVHLQLPGINKICKKLNIDCAPAITGFDFHNGWCHPTLDGFVICKEFEDTVLDAWNVEQDEAERKEEEKRNKRVYGNWRKLIKGLFIRARLQAKYNFKGEEEESEAMA
ncbi:hypothetical protein DMENIID0001_132070 [Sergentomyia squamirostris]